MATDETLQEKYIRELLDPRSALSPREVAAAEEIRALRAKLGISDKKADKDVKSREVKSG
jgi:hypothetical protein